MDRKVRTAFAAGAALVISLGGATLMGGSAHAAPLNAQSGDADSTGGVIHVGKDARHTGTVIHSRDGIIHVGKDARLTGDVVHPPSALSASPVNLPPSWKRMLTRMTA